MIDFVNSPPQHDLHALYMNDSAREQLFAEVRASTRIVCDECLVLSPHHVTLSIETKVVKARGSDGIAVRWTADPSAPVLRVREEAC